MREQRIVLKDHGGLAAVDRNVVDPPRAKKNVAGIGLVETGNHAQRRRLAAARWPEQRSEACVGNVERDVVDSRGDAADEAFAQVDQADVRLKHWVFVRNARAAR